MIEDTKVRMKIAESPAEALLERTAANTEELIRQGELELDINRVVLQYLKSRKGTKI